MNESNSNPSPNEHEAREKQEIIKLSDYRQLPGLLPFISDLPLEEDADEMSGEKGENEQTKEQKSETKNSQEESEATPVLNKIKQRSPRQLMVNSLNFG